MASPRHARYPTRVSRGSYLFVLPVPAYPLGGGRFAVESAFADHLKMLKRKLGDLAERMVLLAPRMTDADYERGKSAFAVLDAATDGIRFRPAFSQDTGRIAYALQLGDVLGAVYEEVKDAAVVHAGYSHLYRPFEFPALMLARALGKKTISVTDIDNRSSARMLYESGALTWRELLVTKLFHQPYIDVQQRIVARVCSLVLYKGTNLVNDYGAGRDNVKPFLDAAFSEQHIIPDAAVEEKLRAVADTRTPLRLTYFGRLVAYKGVDHMLRAVAHARTLGADVEMHVIGDGAERARLEALRDSLALTRDVTFHGAVPFGDALFTLLRTMHVLLAAPLSEDTPRSALDAMASAQMIVAYDSAYYRELRSSGAPVELVRWNDVEEMGRRIAALAADRTALAQSMRAAVRFAHDNTQERWLDRRVEWTKALFT
jgi:glycosyltransferase involved in cell wall biosynthesis